MEGHGFLDGVKSLKRRCEALTGFAKKRTSGNGTGNFLMTIRKE